ncbi:hypothetical protein NPIL_530551, partial [Nephila pilipes]
MTILALETKNDREVQNLQLLGEAITDDNMVKVHQLVLKDPQMFKLEKAVGALEAAFALVRPKRVRMDIFITLK